MSQEVVNLTEAGPYTLTGTFASLPDAPAKVVDQDEAILHLFWIPAEVGALLELRVRVSQDGTDYVYLTIKDDDAANGISVRRRVTYNFLEEDGAAVEHGLEVSLPVAENLIDVLVQETSTVKGTLRAKVVSNILGRS